MKRQFQSFGVIAIIAVIGLTALSMTGCPTPGGGGNTGPKTLSGAITISPSADVTTGTLLTATYSGKETVTYLWMNGETNVGTNSATYTPPEAGSYTVTVSAADYDSKTSAAVIVTGDTLPELTGTVSISGTAEVGQTLTADTDSLEGDGTFSYQWKRGGTNIGTDKSSYKVKTADVGSTITVTVTRSGNSSSVTSDPTDVVETASTIKPVEMVPVPGGSFLMGNPDTSVGWADERPVHTVTLANFSMSKYQVTQDQYQAVMENNPSYFHGGPGREPASGEVQGNRPVEQVSWYDAIEFCNALSVQEGLNPYYNIDKENRDPNNTNDYDWYKWTVTRNNNANGYRLPTEAQWEYAAKGGNGTPGNYTYAGSNTVGAIAWYGGNSGGKTHEVEMKQPNSLDIYDMSGNVWEWCWDWYGNYSSGAQTNPVGAGSGGYRVSRGGSWGSGAPYARSVIRLEFKPDKKSNNIGFRLVRP